MYTRFYDAVIIICVLICQSVVPLCAFSPPVDIFWTQRRSVDDDGFTSNDDVIDSQSHLLRCGEELRSEAGSYTYLSGGEGSFCTLYLLAPPDMVLEVEFPFFDVSCAENSAVALLDGWEIDGQLFPSANDHPQLMEQRYLPFCGVMSPPDKVISRQNLMQVMFEVPQEGQGFVIKVNFKVNPKPCNMMLWSQQNENIVLRNYGNEENCTVMSLYPQMVQFMYVSVGEKGKDSWFSRPTYKRRQGLKPTCGSAWGEDAVKVYQGHGVGPVWRQMVMGFCGEKYKVSRAIPLLCHTSSVTLMSSGQFYNKVMFSFLPVAPDEDVMC